MCDLVGKAVRAGVTRRTLFAGAGSLAAAGMLAACSSDTAPLTESGAARASAPSAARAPLSADGAATKTVLLGTSGGPAYWEGAERGGISSAVVVGDRFYVVDAGEGVGRQLRDSGLWRIIPGAGDVDNVLGGIFLTHLHSDHIVDLNTLMLLGLFHGLDRLPEKVPIWGPGNRGEIPPLFGEPPVPPVVAPENPTPGTREMVDLLIRAYATDFNDRSFDNRKPVPEQIFEARDVPIPERYLAEPNRSPHPRMSAITFYEDDRVKVSATLVQHAPVFPALAYRFDTEEGSVVFSGDTGPSDNLIELATDADVLVHEVISRRWAEESFPEPRTEAQEGLLNHLVEAHTVTEDVGAIAESAGVRTLVLNHFVPGNLPDAEWESAVNGFSGQLIVGRDFDEIPL